MSVSVNYTSMLDVVETLTVPDATGPNSTVTHNQWSVAQLAQGSGSVPACGSVISFVGTLSTGAVTIDLTSLTGIGGGTVTLSGAKISYCKIQNISTHDIVFTFGASNGYLLLGSAWKFTLKAGQEFLFGHKNAAASTPTVGSGAKTIDVTGTGSDTFNMIIVANQ